MDEARSTAEKPRIGFIGLGVMGSPMAGHLAHAGYPVTVYDINEQAMQRLRAAHSSVRIATSPRELASMADIVVTMLPSGREVRSTVLGADGVLEGLRSGGLLLDTSSSEPEVTQELTAKLATKGIDMVDAPVSGAEAGAVEASLVFMVGGGLDSVARVKPLLDVLGRATFHLGPVGSGHAMKSINNLITAVTFLATAEGLVIGKAYGLDPAVMNEVLNESTGMSWITRTHISQRILSRRFDDPFKLDLMVKDMNIAMGLAQRLSLELPLTTATLDLWHKTQAGVERGSSVSELVRALEQRTGVELK